MKKQILSTAVLLLTLTILLPSISFASGHGRRQGPPAKAITAYEGKSIGERVKATVREIERRPAAAPKNMPKKSGHPRPRQ